MTMSSQEKTPRILPAFRKDLKIYRGPDDEDGSPTYNLQDPVRGQYYKLGWKESLIFKCMKPGMSTEDLAKTINSISTLKITAAEIEMFFQQAAYMDLLRLPKTSDHYQALADRKKPSWWMWLLHNYLYLRIPIISPDKFLARTLHYVEFLGSPKALAFYALVTFLGMFLVLSQWSQFLHTFTYFFNLQGLIIYGLAISVVKLIHEFSHAYVAKHFKIHVPTMGIAFIVLWPVLYTDVTDGWKLPKRYQRLAISFAGIAAEIIVAGLATLGWALSGPGMLQSVFFVLASTSWVSSLLINVNPAVRFDGYYMLCDLWGIDNLQNRAFDVTRWKYLDIFFGIKLPCPEQNPSQKRIWGMVIYTIYTWTYRIFLYTAIALFVYYEFTKALGIILFIAEVIIFMIWPIYYEGKQIYMVREKLTMNKKTIFTSTILGLLLAWFVLPWPHQETFNAVVEPVEHQDVYVPYNSIVEKIYVKRGQHLEINQPIIKLKSKDLLRDLGTASLQKEALEKEVLLASMNTQNTNDISEKKAELAKANEYYKQMKDKQNLLDIRSEISGVLYDWDNDLKEGHYVPEGKVLGKIADRSSKYIIAYVPETYVSYFSIGQEATILVRSPLNFLEGSVERINPIRKEVLSRPGLSSISHGPLPVVADPQGRSLKLVESYYEVFVKSQDKGIDSLKYGQIVEVRVRGPWTSKLMQLISYISRILLRESSL